MRLFSVTASWNAFVEISSNDYCTHVCEKNSNHMVIHSEYTAETKGAWKSKLQDDYFNLCFVSIWTSLMGFTQICKQYSAYYWRPLLFLLRKEHSFKLVWFLVNFKKLLYLCGLICARGSRWAHRWSWEGEFNG